MSNLAIKAVNLGKLYQIRSDPGHAARRTLQEDIIDLFAPGRKRPKESLWALKDVSFEVDHGEVVGIIGRNGAGKSTLLKILSRITEPTTGYVDLYGRTGSLLEVGTGFHSELTGRENIYLGGAVLGMTKKEIDRKFDEIVDFSGVEKFLNTPVKRYSSGMKVRLAFSVAAHLEPEILLVDEVLAVGDAEFRKKSLGKMDEVAKGGRTVLFVSHNLSAVKNLCSRCILMNKGEIISSGTPDHCISAYTLDIPGRSPVSLALKTDRQGNGDARFIDHSFGDEHDHMIQGAVTGAPLNINLQVENSSGRTLQSVRLAIGFDTLAGDRVLLCDNDLVGERLNIPVGTSAITLRIDKLPLVAGQYSLNLFLGNSGASSEVIDWLKDAIILEVEHGDYYGTGYTPTSGLIMTEHSWKIG